MTQQNCLYPWHIFAHYDFLQPVVLQTYGCQIGELATLNVKLRKLVCAQVNFCQLTDVELLKVYFLQLVLRQVQLLEGIQLQEVTV